MREIEWERYRDPFLPLDVKDLVEEDGYDLIGRTWRKEEATPSPYRGPYLYGPFGLIPLNESNLPTKLYKLWMGHTNFTLSAKEQNAIENVEGVEVLRILSRYRFMLGVGKMFEDEEVKQRIIQAVCPPPPPPAYMAAEANKIDYLSWYMKTKHPHWAVVREADRFDAVGGEEESDVRSRVGDREVLAASWDEEGGDQRGAEGGSREQRQPQPHEE